MEELTLAAVAAGGRPHSQPAEGRTAPAPVLRVENIAIRFARPGHDVHAVRGVSFALRERSTLTLLGESGSGKSALLRSLTGLLPDYARVTGRMAVGGAQLAEYQAADVARLRGSFFAMVFQEPATAFDPLFTIGEQLVEAIVAREGIRRRQARERAHDLLAMVAIPAPARRLGNYPHELSGGMLQRAMIAVALASRPSVLLADEPTTALDTTVQIQILLLLRKLQADVGMSIIFVTHDIAVAAEISDDVAVMYAGEFVETGDVRSVIRAAGHPYTQGLLASTAHDKPHGSMLEAIPGSALDAGASVEGCAFEPRCRYAEASCAAGPIRLAEIAPGHLARCIRHGGVR